MSLYTVDLIESVEQLRRLAGPWDDLWRRSPLSRPTLRAEQLALWLEAFACDAPFRAVVVSEGPSTRERTPRLVAALPLIEQRLAGWKPIATLPANEWSVGGELLWDPLTNHRAVLELLIAGLRDSPWSLLKLDDVEPAAPRWQRFVAAAAGSDVSLSYRAWCKVGRIDVTGGWEQFRGTWSRRHRQQMSRHLRRLAGRGEIRLRWLDRLRPDMVQDRLRRGLEIEHCGWKGEHGTSVLSNPAIAEFYRRQASEMARHGELVLAFLEVGAQPIAFAYGMAAKGVYRSLKVGYDPAWAQFSPGQLLRLKSFQRLFSDPAFGAVESISPTPAHARWRPQSYEIGRLLLAVNGMLGRLFVGAERAWRG